LLSNRILVLSSSSEAESSIITHRGSPFTIFILSRLLQEELVFFDELLFYAPARKSAIFASYPPGFVFPSAFAPCPLIYHGSYLSLTPLPPLKPNLALELEHFARLQTPEAQWQKEQNTYFPT
jgi:hypothetical protein